MLISEFSIFSNKFSKNKFKNKNKIKIQFFYRIFIKTFQNFLKISQQFAFFVQTLEKLTHGFFEFFWKISKNNAFLAIFLWKFSKIFSKIKTKCIVQKIFWKIAKIMHFRNFLKKIFSKFSTNCLSSPNPQQINPWYVNLFENMQK